MELTADHDLCEGNAVCVGLAPKVLRSVTTTKS